VGVEILLIMGKSQKKEKKKQKRVLQESGRNNQPTERKWRQETHRWTKRPSKYREKK